MSVQMILQALILTFLAGIFLLGIRYITFSSRIQRGWNKLHEPENVPRSDLPQVSVIVCFRNEEKYLASLIKSLTEQEYPKNLLEILLVDDHSTDESSQIARKAIETDYRIHYVPLAEEQKGKHAALVQGIAHASGRFVALTDADCEMGPGWLKSMVECLPRQKESLILGPVKIRDSGNFLNKFQALENCAVLMVTAGMAGRCSPVMASGANMLFPRHLFAEYLQQEVKTKSAGDDVWFLHYIKQKNHCPVVFNKSRRAQVTTYPQLKFRDFIHQRIRWLSKGRYYTDKTARQTMLFIGSVNIALSILFIGAFFHPVLKGAFFMLFFFKYIGDIGIISPAARFLNQSHILWYSLPAAFLYPFYTLLLAVVSNRKYLWKDRVYP